MRLNYNFILLLACLIAIFFLFLFSKLISAVFAVVFLIFWILATASPKIHIFGAVINHGSRKSKKVALTFDDGPYGSASEKILDILKEKNAKATFFVLGNNAGKYPRILKRMTAEGHLVGNHSLDHSSLLFLKSRKNYLKNMTASEENIFSVLGKRPRFFRPPWGLKYPEMMAALESKGYLVILWDIITLDPFSWAGKKIILRKIMNNLRPGSIIALHDGRDTKIDYPRNNIIEALPEIIDGIRAKGFEIAPLDQLIGEKAYF
ncbi:MAG: polysaccharide deacetylase family protein [Candidatus Moranbacteria bacterium]|nr:polysaccharide deacetylase family protein [Candidatus Moranbacteria bacterium]